MNPPTPPLGGPMPHWGIYGLMMMMMMMMSSRAGSASAIEVRVTICTKRVLLYHAAEFWIFQNNKRKAINSESTMHSVDSHLFEILHGDHRNSRLLLFSLSLNCLLLLLSGIILLPSQKIAVYLLEVWEKNLLPRLLFLSPTSSNLKK